MIYDMSRIVSETQTFHPSWLEVLDVNGASVSVSNVNRFIGASGSTTSSMSGKTAFKVIENT